MLPYYQSVWSSDILVDKSEGLDKQTTYTVTVLKQIKGQSFQVAFIAPKGDLESQVAIDSPYRVSSEPLQGSYVITCRNSEQVEFKTREIGYQESAEMVNLYLQLDVPFLQLKVLVRDSLAYKYIENGISLAIVFLGFQKDQPSCEISSGTQDPITGSEPLVFRSDTLQRHGKNLLFEPVPLEMLFTDEQEPQVRVKVNGMDALCVTFDCSYTFEGATNYIDSQFYEP